MINLVVALACEARPLIRAYGLKAQNGPGPFGVYRGKEIALVVSGMGKINAAAACGYLFAVTGCVPDAVWLNVGIAGHRDRPVGDVVVAHRVCDVATGRTWYPPQIVHWSCPTDCLHTVDRPETEYPEPGLYDMEAAGFYSVASRFATAELSQVCKVVSDNRRHTPQSVTSSFVEALMESHTSEVDGIIGELRELSAELSAIHSPPSALEQFLSRWHFTVYQQRRLVRLLRQWEVRSRGEEPWSDALRAAPNANAVLRILQEGLNGFPVQLA